MTPDQTADATHAALLARIDTAKSRLEDAATELKLALTELEALSRLTGSSNGKPIAVFVPPVAGGHDHTFIVSTCDLRDAMLRLADLEPPSLPSATILTFPLPH